MDLPSCQNLDLETKCSSHAAANLQCNTYKNRYATIIPCKDGSCREGGVYCSFLWHQMITPEWLYLYKTTYLGQIISMHHSLM